MPERWFEAHLEPKRFQHTLKCAEPRISVRRQGFMQSLAANRRIASQLRDSALRLRDQAKRVEHRVHVAVLLEFLQGELQCKVSILRVLQVAKPNLVVRNGATFAGLFHALSSK